MSEVKVTSVANETWTARTIGDTGKYINGLAFKPTDWGDDGMPIIRIQNLTNPTKPLNRTTRVVDPAYVVNPGDILVSWSATLDAFIWDREPALLNQHIFKVVPDTSVVTKKFLFYTLKKAIAEMIKSEHLHGSTMKHINRGPFLAHKIEVPTLKEQDEIVAELEKQFSRLDEAVANLQRVKANLKRYKASVLKAAVEGRLVETEATLARREGRTYETGEQLLQRILEARRKDWQGRGKYKAPVSFDSAELNELPKGWAWASIDQLAAPGLNSITDGPFGSNLKSEHYQENGPRVIRLQNIKDGEFADAYAHITHEHFERLHKHQIFAGDLVIASLGESPPRACIIPPSVGPAIVKADCIRFKPHSAVSVEYLNAALNCQPTRKRVKDVLHGIGRPRLSLGEIRAIALPIPPEAEQSRIDAEVDRRISLIRGLESEVDTNLKRAQALRQATLQKFFSGGDHGVPN